MTALLQAPTLSGVPITSTASAPPRREPALDGLRGVAVLLVFLFHYGGGSHVPGLVPHLLGSLTQAGWIGVELFFVLSGFLITSILLHTPPQARSLRNFFARRALRILPLYSFALLACAVVALLGGASLADLKSLAIYTGFLQNMPPLVEAALHTPPPLPVFHLWSLAVEVQFYLVWPLAVLLARTPAQVRRLSWGLFALVFLVRCVVFRAMPYHHALLWATCFPLRGGSLALGSALAAQRKAASVVGRPAAGWVYPSAALASFVILGLQLHSFLLDSAWAFCFLLPTASLLCSSAVAHALRRGSWSAMLTVRPLAALGRISYGVYVLHILLQPVFDSLARAVTHSTSGAVYQAARFAWALPLTIAAAALSFRLLEQPFLRLGARFPEAPAMQPTP